MIEKNPAQIIPSAATGEPLASEGRNGKTVSIVTLDRDTRRILQQMIDQNERMIQILMEIRDARL